MGFIAVDEVPDEEDPPLGVGAARGDKNMRGS
jgi:hypothetical protein